MSQKLDLLEQRIDEVSDVVDRLKRDNAGLSAENARLTQQIEELREANRKLLLSQTDRSSAVKTKLQAVLTRVEELEDLKL